MYCKNQTPSNNCLEASSSNKLVGGGYVNSKDRVSVKISDCCSIVADFPLLVLDMDVRSCCVWDGRDLEGVEEEDGWKNAGREGN